jgi:hypothetical protein
MQNTPVDKTQLRKFGLILGCGLIAIFGLLFPFMKEQTLPSWPYAIGAIVLIPTFIQPMWLKIIYTPWMKIGHILGFINTRIILGFIFFVMITPMGLVMRLMGKDPMCRKLDGSASYRKISASQTKEHMERPF